MPAAIKSQKIGGGRSRTYKSSKKQSHRSKRSEVAEAVAVEEDEEECMWGRSQHKVQVHCRA
jgi:hypothetical protein